MVTAFIPSFIFTAQAAVPDTNIAVYGSQNGDDEAVTVPSDKSSITIDLTAETIELGSFTVAAYSINGGVKWIKGPLPEDAVKFCKLFDKELTLWLSDTYNERDVKEDGVIVENKGVPSNADIVKFPKINARPKANAEKLAAYYADSTWSLMTKPTKTTAATAPLSVYEYAKGSTADGKLPADSTWLISPESGFGILSKPEKSDKSKNIYYFRSTASSSGDVYTPASKAFKISPAYYGNVLKYKINYKTEVLKLKKGEFYSTDDGTSWTEVTEQKGILLDVSAIITSGMDILVKKGATGVKPRSIIQTITPVGRVAIEDKTFTCAKGKITDTAELKKYEILSKDSKGNDKWGSLQRITESKEFDIRLKTSAKFSKDTWTGNAASVIGKLTITYGAYDESGKTPKNGIIAASITADDDSFNGYTVTFEKVTSVSSVFALPAPLSNVKEFDPTDGMYSMLKFYSKADKSNPITEKIVLKKATTVYVDKEMTRDKTALEEMITVAKADVEAIKVSADGSDIYKGTKWITSAVKEAYLATIAAAQAVVNNFEKAQINLDSLQSPNTTQEELDAAQAELDAALAELSTAISALISAATVFETAQKDGTLNNAPVVIEDHGYHKGIAAPASNDGKVDAVPFTLDVSKCFFDSDGDKLTYSIVEADCYYSGGNKGPAVKGELTLSGNGSMLTYTPAADDAEWIVYITVKANDGQADSEYSTLIEIFVGPLPSNTYSVIIPSPVTYAGLTATVTFDKKGPLTTGDILVATVTITGTPTENDNYHLYLQSSTAEQKGSSYTAIAAKDGSFSPKTVTYTFTIKYDDAYFTLDFKTLD